VPTNWTEATQDQTGWTSTGYPPGTEFVLFMGVLMPVDANGDPVTPQEATTWTRGTQSATSFTEATQSATSWTEASG
jgi:hypothetical protein